jgi:hypothetical protein
MREILVARAVSLPLAKPKVGIMRLAKHCGLGSPNAQLTRRGRLHVRCVWENQYGGPGRVQHFVRHFTHGEHAPPRLAPGTLSLRGYTPGSY